MLHVTSEAPLRVVVRRKLQAKNSDLSSHPMRGRGPVIEILRPGSLPRSTRRRLCSGLRLRMTEGAGAAGEGEEFFGAISL